MTNPAIEAMARAVLRRNISPALSESAATALIEDEIASNGVAWREAKADALAALRALAGQEPSEGMASAWAGANGPIEEWAAMLAQLVKEVENAG